MLCWQLIKQTKYVQAKSAVKIELNTAKNIAPLRPTVRPNNNKNKETNSGLKRRVYKPRVIMLLKLMSKIVAMNKI